VIIAVFLIPAGYPIILNEGIKSACLKLISVVQMQDVEPDYQGSACFRAMLVADPVLIL
jgi:hypothetical protein